uniref:glucose-6-phosphate 1-epimerase n=2 Tax=Diabrotica virgifera virgifera TaxID=50390 RepID=A0A6P7FZ00_DIAVI
MDARESTEGKIVTLDRGDYTTCTINLQGATVVSWRINNEEQLFVSRRCTFSKFNNIRGGVRLVWPHYSTWSFGRRHGFGRDMLWRVLKGPELLLNGDVFVVVGVTSNQYTKSMWNFDFEMHNRITLHSSQLTMAYTVINKSPYFDFDFHINLQTYVKVSDISTMRIVGLENFPYDDQVITDGTSMFIEKEKEIRVQGEFDRIYQEVPKLVNIYMDKNKQLSISLQNLPDLGFFNPGPEKAKKMDDLDDDEWKYFLVVQPAHVVSTIKLERGTSWNMSVTLEVRRTDEKEIQYKNFYDYFDKYC